MVAPDTEALSFETPEAFLDWQQRQETKHELVDGVPVAMAGANELHSIIQGNLLAAALGKLRGGPCRAFTLGMAVKIAPRHARFPDMTIDCGPRRRDNPCAPDPRVVFEVVSPATQMADRTVKLAEYNALKSIVHYVLVGQAEPRADVYTRDGSGDFSITPQEISGLDGIIDLAAVGISIAMSEVYEGVEF